MNEIKHCPECGAVWDGEDTCLVHFEQMLYWEAEAPERGVVHHLMVLCYHLQHPRLYSPEMLPGARQMLKAFVVEGVTPKEMRRRMRVQVASNNRTWKISGDKEPSSYARPIPWTMRAADVVAGGAEQYVESVTAWAQACHEALKVLDGAVK
jgi:Family of unknown function (DUF5946)